MRSRLALSWLPPLPPVEFSSTGLRVGHDLSLALLLSGITRSLHLINHCRKRMLILF
ncbi:hypothetical protein JW905_01720 [bacterium]|nr:hypothetical protein [candidate division CSSED10-310 bacterium]